jgi:hypothetical protein
MSIGPEMKKQPLIGITVAALLLLAGFYLWGPSKTTPAGQPSLSVLSASNFSEFQNAFDSAADEPRIILLLSPT